MSVDSITLGSRPTPVGRFCAKTAQQGLGFYPGIYFIHGYWDLGVDDLFRLGVLEIVQALNICFTLLLFEPDLEL